MTGDRSLRKRVLAIVAGAIAVVASPGLALADPARDGTEIPGMGRVPVEHATAIRTYPHDTRAFTEGLFIENGEMFESTGLVGRSSLRRVDLATGKVLEQVDLAAPMFGEGIAPWHDQILSLTWLNGTGFRWQAKHLDYLSRFTYLGEGWGLTRMGDALVMSDGTPTLRVMDPATYRLIRTIPVTVDGRPLAMLNELEWVDGEILANIWQTDLIARIDPSNGHVTGWIDLSALHAAVHVGDRDADVANGIAWDAAHRRLYVTGKEWPSLFEIAPPKRR